MVLCIDFDRSRPSLEVSAGPQSSNRTSDAAFKSENSIVIDEGVVLHDREVDTTTLSPECHQPCHQSVIGHADTARSHTPQGFS